MTDRIAEQAAAVLAAWTALAEQHRRAARAVAPQVCAALERLRTAAALTFPAQVREAMAAAAEAHGLDPAAPTRAATVTTAPTRTTDRQLAALRAFANGDPPPDRRVELRNAVGDLLAERAALRAEVKQLRASATPAHADLVRAIADPGQFVPRGDDYRESVPSWSARAVLALLEGRR